MTKQSRSSKSPPQKARSASSRSAVPFPYIALTQGGRLKPAVPLVIHTVRRPLTVRALVDSGADHSILPKSYAAMLGIDLAEAREVPCQTASGPGVYLVASVPLEAQVQGLDRRFAMRAAFAEHALTILLGRDDFFAAFWVTFDHPNETFWLEPL